MLVIELVADCSYASLLLIFLVQKRLLLFSLFFKIFLVHDIDHLYAVHKDVIIGFVFDVDYLKEVGLAVVPC